MNSELREKSIGLSEPLRANVINEWEIFEKLADLKKKRQYRLNVGFYSKYSQVSIWTQHVLAQGSMLWKNSLKYWPPKIEKEVRL